ncbi:hypothetical protein [Dyadobacter sp. CY326]|uniref:hypothetical protein n=1 Tax=Dyadobacter sp. CY326 TaxID=2907300 RepID=UPI001F3D4A96|nr:hypothetical protein [Dyadobacter sp. CY326]MCE7065759.1 hypothetical protein [Dyadobacter sp. CY326]
MFLALTTLGAYKKLDPESVATVQTEGFDIKYEQSKQLKIKFGNDIVDPKSFVWKIDETMIGLCPFVKKYWSATKLIPYLEGFGTFASTTGVDLSNYKYSVAANLGLADSLNRKWLVEARLLQLSGGEYWLADFEPGLEASRFNVALEGAFKPNFTISYIFLLDSH